jgi:hypothetical protein
MSWFLERVRLTQCSFITEFALAWMLVFVCSIRYMIDYLQLILKMALLKRRPETWCHEIPITNLPQTRQRFAVSTETRIQQLTELLNEQLKCSTTDNNCWSDEQVIQVLQSQLLARQFASLIMVPGGPTTTAQPHHPLILQLQRIWRRVLEFPPLDSEINYPYEISLIVPAYKEQLEHIEYILTHARTHSSHPEQVQVFVVDAGECPGLSEQSLLLRNNTKGLEWGSLQVVVVPHASGGGGGRGACLNFGAAQAQGRILTFLHSDTLLPAGWDDLVRQALSNTDADNKTSTTKRKIITTTHACAFSMGIDLSPRGLLHGGGRCPPGIVGADRVLASLRCKLCSLPYGDSALSFPSRMFHYLGGYPDQPLMEDYEIMTLLRKRAHLLNEKLVIFPARTQCSPRRWQAFGVCYTTLINALCIHRYKQGATAEDLFEFYYRRPTKKTS